MLFAEIEARLGYSLSPTTILQVPTIARLAEFIRTTIGVAASQSLVPLRPSGSGLPLFLVHNRYCYVMYYRHLLRDLNSDRPVFGLQPLPLDGKHRIPRTIESMAADYVKEIRQVQAHGPYFLAGHSFGGRESFEIAQQLVREGERVSFLGIIDTTLHDTAKVARMSEAVRVRHKVRAVNSFQDLLFRGLRFIKNAVSLRRRCVDSTGAFPPLRAPPHLLRMALSSGKPRLCAQALYWSHHDVQQRGQFRKAASCVGDARPWRADRSRSARRTRRHGLAAIQQSPRQAF